MEARELRVGNLVSWIDKDKFYQVSIQALYEGANEYYKPIPLTEEWLVNFGFNQYNGWDDLKYWSLPNEYSNNFKFDLVESEDGYELPSGVICKYVHLLQNAYFFHYCNGQELTLKDK